jgi:myo-inositol-1(or 4)-monophosphatase
MIQLTKARDTAVLAARAAGSLMRRNLNAPKKATGVFAHDIKLELDVRAQGLIERKLGRAFPGVGFLGEEGGSGDQEGECRWVVDPIDGTVNFAYGIPHACVAIALQRRARRGARSVYEDGYQTAVGVVYDPFCDELWTAIRGGPTRLNGRVVRVSRRAKLAEAIVALGSPHAKAAMTTAWPRFLWLAQRARKVRVNGSAALALCYVASGRFDAYVESGVHLWDIAAGALLIECAGGEFREERMHAEHTYTVVACNGRLGGELRFGEKHQEVGNF